MLSRRTFLVTGSASVCIAGTFTASRLLRDSPEVREPWAAAARGFGDVRMNALAYAILAPNPHNRQPWVVSLDEQKRLTLYCDLERRLPQTDPFDRQITVGLGAFLELMRMAAAQQKHRLDVTFFPDGEPQPRLDQRPIASIQFVENNLIDPDTLFEQALMRRTSRVEFEQKPVPPTTFAQLRSIAGLNPQCIFDGTAEAERLMRIKALCSDGWKVESSTTRTHHESTELTRIGAQEVARNPDGISLYGPAMEGYKLMGLLNKDALEDSSSQAARLSLQFYKGLIESAQAFCWIGSPGNSRADQLRSGADWVRLHLAATRLGLSFQPLSQILQEFPEMNDLYDRFHTFAGLVTPARAQGLFRLGYAKASQPSPRWPLSSRLIKLP